MNKAQKFFAVLFALFIGLLGLGMSLCGGAFLPMAFSGSSRDRLMMLLLTGGSIVAGVAFMYSTYRVLRGVGSEDRQQDVSKWLIVSVLLLAGGGLLAMSICGGFRLF